ncbi:hypothetical protein NL676_035016 [Syzygium grande]|nr:hypothetical protein NL676_035016 [Syzygium grande]
MDSSPASIIRATLKDKRNFNGNKNQRRSNVRCQICNRPRHKAVACQNRFNQQFGFSRGHTHQQQSLPPQVQLAEIPPPPSVLSPDAWYPDLGATHHITNNPHQLSSVQPYHGTQESP